MNIYNIYDSSKGELPLNIEIREIKRFTIDWSKNIEFIFLISGKIDIYIEGEVYNLKEGDLFLINKNKAYRLVRPDRKEGLILKFSIGKDCYNESLGGLDKTIFDSSDFFYSGEKLDFLKYSIASMIYELDLQEKAYEFRVLSSLNLFISYLLENFQYSLDEKLALENKSNRERLESIVSYIHQNYDRRIGLKEMADKLHLSYYYLSHFIKDSMGISFKRYVDFIRVGKSLDKLIDSEKTISEIAYEVGFPNPSSYSKSFKNLYDFSPGEYRDRFEKSRFANKEAIDKFSLTSEDLRKICLNYKSLYDEDISRNAEEQTIDIDLDLNLDRPRESLDKYWNNLICLGRGSEYLRNSFEKQLKMVQKEIAFKNVKVNGIYLTHDEFASLKGRTDFSNYDWTYINKLFDILLSNNLNPYIELSHVSGTSGNYVPEGWWEDIVPPPSDFESWLKILDSFMRNIINRYGIREVEKWYFEIWNEARLNYIIWNLTPEDYFLFYEIMARRIKTFSPNIKVGGLGLSYNGNDDLVYIESFLNHCRREKIPIDFVSVKMYPEYVEPGSRGESVLGLKDEDFIARSLGELETIKKDYGVELYITEWSSSISFENPIHNKTYAASYILDQIAKCYGKTKTMGYWIMSDLVENYSFNEFLDSGGYGLLTRDGIKKPSYYVYYLLNKLGNQVLLRSERYIVTRSGENLQILLFNHVHGEEEAEESIFFNLNIKSIDGKYKETVYTLDRDNGSAYDQWMRLGKTIDLSIEELDYIKRLSVPRINIGERVFDGTYLENIRIAPNGIKLIVLERRY